MITIRSRLTREQHLRYRESQRGQSINETLIKNRPPDSSFSTASYNYEQDPRQALDLFWETSALYRHQANIGSPELLQEIKDCVIPDEIKNNCLQEFKDSMECKKITLSCCSVCNRSTMDDVSLVPFNTLPDLLRVKEEKLEEISQSPYLKAYTIHLAHDKTAYHLNPDFFINHQLVPICCECFSSLSQSKLPMYSLANGYDLGNWRKLNIPQLNEAEKIAISLYRPFAKIIKLVGPHGLGHDTQQTALRGHVIHIPLDGAQVLCTEFPRRDIYSSIEVMFVGTRDQFHLIKNGNPFKHFRQMFTLRFDVVIQWLQILKHVNPLYANIPLKDFTEEEKNELNMALDRWLENIIMADDEITRRIEKNSVSNVATIIDNTEECGLHAVLLTSHELNKINDNERSLKSIQKLMTDTNPRVEIHQENVLVNEFGENDIMFLGAYPWLFLFGQGIPHKGTQPKQWFQYILNYADNRFSTEQTLLLSLFNQRQRHEAAKTVAAKMKSNPKRMEDFITYINEVTFEDDLVNAIKFPTSYEAKNILKNLLPTLNITGSSVPFGPLERNKSLSELYALCQHFGLPTWFITISPSDIDSTLVMKLSGVPKEDLKLIVFDYEQRAKISAMNPLAGAKFFNRLVTKVFSCLFQTTANGESNVRKTTSYHSRKVGILGKMISHFMVFEVQGRGSLHLHALLWATLSPLLLQKIAHVPELVNEVQAVLNSMVSAEISRLGYKEFNQRKKDQVIYHAQLHPCPDFMDRENFHNRVEAVVSTVNVHNHRPTCHKGKSGKFGCRFCYPQSIVNNGPRPVQLQIDEKKHVISTEEIEQPIRSNSADSYYPIDSRDHRTIVWELQRRSLVDDEQEDDNFPILEYKYHNGNVVPFNHIISAALGCNTCIEPLGSTEQAKSAIFYQL